MARISHLQDPPFNGRHTKADMPHDLDTIAAHADEINSRDFHMQMANHSSWLG